MQTLHPASGMGKASSQSITGGVQSQRNARRQLKPVSVYQEYRHQRTQVEQSLSQHLVAARSPPEETLPQRIHNYTEAEGQQENPLLLCQTRQ